MKHNTWKRRAPAIAAVLLLSVPSAIGVQKALAPTRGDVASWLAAAGFECVYLATALLILTSDLRRHAQRVALAAVGAAVLLNTIADYAARVPGGLASASQAWHRFDGLSLALSLIESLPLAGLAYAMASLLHRLGEQAETAPAMPAMRTALAHGADPTAETDYASVRMLPTVNGSSASSYACPNCGTALSMGKYAAARRYGHCAACKQQ